MTGVATAPPTTTSRSDLRNDHAERWPELTELVPDDDRLAEAVLAELRARAEGRRPRGH